MGETLIHGVARRIMTDRIALLGGGRSIRHNRVSTRSVRLVDGADEVHLSQIARHVMDAFTTEGSVRTATGGALL